MGRNLYNMALLSKFQEFDAVAASKNFDSSGDYFDTLAQFTDTAGDYLQGYTASVVIFNRGMLNRFLMEMKRIAGTLTALGMESAVSKLRFLREAVEGKDADTLSDGMMTFGAEMAHLAERVAAARIPGPDHDPAARPEDAGTKKAVILAVDDRPEILAAITEAAKHKYRVIAVTNAAAAIKAAVTRSPDIILLDIEMPDTSGYDLAEMMRVYDELRSVPILFLTSKGTREHVVAAVTHGGRDYILKPVNRDILLDRIRRHLNREGGSHGQ